MYYLVYKLICNPTLWLVKEDIDLEYIFQDHEINILKILIKILKDFKNLNIQKIMNYYIH